MVTIMTMRGAGVWTQVGKQRIAYSMFAKGGAFLGASILVRRQQGGEHAEYVALHLLCQGLEILGKGYLLWLDYDAHKPKLRQPYGHRLTRILEAVEAQVGRRLFMPATREELRRLEDLYKNNLLRYGSGVDIVVSPRTIDSSRVYRRVVVLLRYGRQIGRLPKPRA